MNKGSVDEYLELDETLNPIDSLETIVDLLSCENPKWKFSVIAFHHSIYCFAVANLATSNYKVVTNFYSNEDDGWRTFENGKTYISKKEWINKKVGSYKIIWDEIEENIVKDAPMKDFFEHSNEKLINFWTAIARVTDGKTWMKRFTVSKPLIMNDSQWESLGIIHQLRNQFLHYIPMGYAIEIDFIKQHLKNLIEPINFLALETGQLIYAYEEDRLRVKEVIKKIENLL